MESLCFELCIKNFPGREVVDSDVKVTLCKTIWRTYRNSVTENYGWVEPRSQELRNCKVCVVLRQQELNSAGSCSVGGDVLGKCEMRETIEECVQFWAWILKCICDVVS